MAGKEKQDTRQIYFLVDGSGTVKNVFVAKDNEEASEYALNKGGKGYTAERVSSKNWRRIKDTLGESSVGTFRDFRRDMNEAFTRMGLSPDQAETAARGRDLDPRATLNALGLSEADFRDFDDFEDIHEPLSENSDEMTDEQANEALRMARIRLGLPEVPMDEADLREFNLLP